MIIGGRWQPYPLVQAAKELGCWVLATHYSKSITAIPSADETKMLNPRDTAKAAELIRLYNIEAIVADSDDNALYAAGVLSQEFGFPGPTMRAVEASTNKKILRAICREHGIQQPEFHIGSSLQDLREGIRQLGGFPMIIKPVDNQGGAGVIRIENNDEIETAFRDAMAQSHSQEYIVERFIEGTLVNITGLSSSGGEHTVLTTGSKRIMPGRRPLTVEIVYPAKVEDALLKEAIALHEKVVGALGYDFGLAHSEIVIDGNDKAWLIESTNRGEAWFLSTLALPALTGLDMNQQLVRMATGQAESETESGVSKKKSVVVASLRLGKKEEKMKKIAKLDEVRAMPGILRCEIVFQDGDIIPKNDERIGYLIAAAETPDAAKAIAKQAKSILGVEFWQ